MSKSSISQSDCILWWLRHKGPITPMDALKEFGCFRLSGRIYDIKHKDMLKPGESVVSEIVEFTNVLGKTSRYAQYHLEVTG